MKEMAEKMLGQECIIYTLNSQLGGTIEQVSDGALLLRHNDGNAEIVNLEYVLRIREYPRRKNGKKKGIIAD